MCIAAGLLVLLVWRIDWTQFQRIITQYGPRLYLWLIPIAGLGWLVYVWRWQTLLVPLGLKPPFRELVIDSLVGLFYGLFVPTGLAGDAVRAARVGTRYHVMRKTFLSVVIDRLVALFSVILVFGVQLVGGGLTWQGVRLSWTGWTIIALIIGGGVLFHRRPSAWMEQIKYGLLTRWPSNPLVRQIDQMCDLVQEYAQARHFIALGVVGSVVYQLFVTLSYYAGSRVLGISVGFGDYVWIVALVTLAQILPITIAGLGVREGLFVFLLGQYGVPAASAVALSLVVFSVTLLFGILGGVLELAGVYRTR